jgi:hypothetical protein
LIKSKDTKELPVQESELTEPDFLKKVILCYLATDDGDILCMEISDIIEQMNLKKSKDAVKPYDAFK